MKLNLGCGDKDVVGFEGVDFFSDKAAHQLNLCKFPWPWEDSSIEELYSEHFLEHVPTCFVKADGVSYTDVPEEKTDKDLLCRLMDECYRILKPGGKFSIIVPSGTSSRGFRDPTHRRFFMHDSFFYFNAKWREDRLIGHYLCSCDFDAYVNPIVPQAVLSLPDNVIEQKCNSEWNVALDWNVTLVSRKRD